MSQQSPSPDENWYPALSLRVDRRLTAEAGNILSASLLMAVLQDQVPEPTELVTLEQPDGSLILHVMALDSRIVMPALPTPVE